MTRVAAASVKMGRVFASHTLEEGHFAARKIVKKACHIGNSSYFWLDDGGLSRNN